MKENLIKQIRNAADTNILKIEIFNDEIIFLLWEVEAPLIFRRDLQNVRFDWNYMTIEHQGFPMDMLEEIIAVMKIIDENKDEILKW